MADRPKLVYAVALPLVLYVALTALWVDWGGLVGDQQFAMIKHLFIVLLLAVSLFFYLRIGCLATLAWCAFVPLERYGALLHELSGVLSGGAISLAVIDVVRIMLLLAACLLSTALVFKVHARPTSHASANVNV